MNDRSMFAPLSPAETATAPSIRPRVASKVPIVPVPTDAPPMSFEHPKRGAPTRSWAYHDAEARLVGYVCRWDFFDEAGRPAKEILPVTFCEFGDGRRGWRAKGLPAERPLLGLPAILSRRDASILVCEGEKTRDAAELLFPEMVATTPAHGAKSPKLTDFGPCAGRVVVIATDHDVPGRKDARGKPLHPGRDFGDLVAKLVRNAGATVVLHLAPERMADRVWQGGQPARRPEPIPDGWDLADALDEGWTAATAAELLADPSALAPYVDQPARAAEAAIADSPAPRPWPFRLDAAGVEKRVERVDRETATTTVEWRWFCSALEIAAETRSNEGDACRRRRFLSRAASQPRFDHGARHLRPRGATRIHLDGPAGHQGAMREPGRLAWPVLHLQRRNHWRRFVHEEMILQTNGAVDAAQRTAGTLDGWKDEVARYAVGNSRLVLALSAAFAAPLLYPAAAESGGFHLRGASSTGKSTALVVAGSAWGGGGIRGYVRSWRATANGLEGVAAMHCDCLLCLDEMGQIDGRDAGAVAYMLANGVGKARANRHGEAKPPAEWRVLFLSSGELTLADKIGEDGRGRRAAAGQQVRIVDIPADAGAGLGLFENLHGFVSADAFARHLKFASAQHYGHPSRAFVRKLVDDFEQVASEVRGYVGDFMEENCPGDADGQVSRVAARFGLVATGGEMARRASILPWPAGEAMAGARRCFRDWMAARGGSAPSEDLDAVAAVRRFIELHGTCRFEAMGDLAPRDGLGQAIEQRVTNRVGFRRRTDGGGIEYLVLPEAWKAEVCAGMDANAVAKTLALRGLLLGKDGKLQHQARLPGFERPVRHYRILPNIMSDPDEIEPELF